MCLEKRQTTKNLAKLLHFKKKKRINTIGFQAIKKKSNSLAKKKKWGKKFRLQFSDISPWYH